MEKTREKAGNRRPKKATGARLPLQHPENDRAPVWDRKLDYDVIYRGQKVGRIS